MKKMKKCLKKEKQKDKDNRYFKLFKCKHKFKN